MAVQLYHRDTGSGPAVMLLHAFPLSSAMWLAQREGLADSCRLITPDQRGFGGSTLGHDEPSLDRVVEDLVALLDDKGIDRVLLGGLSMGGYVAMTFARTHPDRLSGLLLADTRAGADPPDKAADRERQAARLLAEDSSTLLLDEVLPALLGETTMRDRALVYGRVKALVQAAPPSAAAWALRAMAARPDATDVLSTLTVPALVVVGDEDAIAPPAEAEAMAAALPQGRLVTIPGAGHLTAVETPDAFNTALREFIAAVG